MAEVGVHLEDTLGAHGEGLAKAGDVGLAEALLAGAVQHRDVGDLEGQLVGQLAGAVRRAVVDDERVQTHAVTAGDLADAGQRVPQVLALVVRGEDDDVHRAESIPSPGLLRRPAPAAGQPSPSTSA